mgnify:CR=1 FL=1
MASFEIVEREGMHWVKASLEDEELRAEAGALSFIEGDIVVDTPVPTFRQFLVATLAEEATGLALGSGQTSGHQNGHLGLVGGDGGHHRHGCHPRDDQPRL